MSKIKISVRPYLAGFLHIDLAVMTTCAASLALLLALWSPYAAPLNPTWIHGPPVVRWHLVCRGADAV